MKLILRDVGLGKFTLGLCLLDSGLTPSMTLLADKGRQKIVLNRAAVSSLKVNGVQATLSLNINDLEVLRHFSLRTIRDGAPEVDHLDLEVSAVFNDEPTTADITILFPVAYKAT